MSRSRSRSHGHFPMRRRRIVGQVMAGFAGGGRERLQALDPLRRFEFLAFDGVQSGRPGLDIPLIGACNLAPRSPTPTQADLQTTGRERRTP